jgi:predicted kinase
MKKVIIGIGIPGSGKTTVLKEFANKYGYVYICPDDIRLEMLGDSADQSKNKEVWGEAHQKMRDHLAQDKTIVFDATFTRGTERRNFIDLARDSGAEKIQGIIFDTPLDIAKERNLNRERQVPEHAIQRMSNDLNAHRPSIEDGFDAVFTLNEYQELVAVESKGNNGEFNNGFKKAR